MPLLSKVNAMVETAKILLPKMYNGPTKIVIWNGNAPVLYTRTKTVREADSLVWSLLLRNQCKPKVQILLDR